MGFSLFTDLDVNEETAKDFIHEKDEELINYMLDRNFEKPTDKDIEIYKFKAGDIPKLKLRVDWKNKTIDVLNETLEDPKPDIVIKLGEATYWKLVNAFKDAIENKKGVGSISLFLEMLYSTSVDVKDQGALGDLNYKVYLIRWINTNYKTH